MRLSAIALATLFSFQTVARAEGALDLEEAQRAQQLEELGHRERAVGITLFVLGMVALTAGPLLLVAGGIDHAIGGTRDESRGAAETDAGYAVLILGGVATVPSVLLWMDGNGKIEDAHKLRGTAAIVGWTWRF